MCPPQVEAQLKKVDGVEKVAVDYDSATATVTLSKDVPAESVAKGLTDKYSGTAIK